MLAMQTNPNGEIGQSDALHNFMPSQSVALQETRSHHVESYAPRLVLFGTLWGGGGGKSVVMNSSAESNGGAGKHAWNPLIYRCIILAAFSERRGTPMTINRNRNRARIGCCAWRLRACSSCLCVVPKLKFISSLNQSITNVQLKLKVWQGIHSCGNVSDVYTDIMPKVIPHAKPSRIMPLKYGSIATWRSILGSKSDISSEGVEVACWVAFDWRVRFGFMSRWLQPFN